MKVAICIPIHSHAKPAFTQSLARMIAFTLTARLEGPDGAIAPLLETYVFSTSNIAFSRRRLADIALEWGADYVLWLDSDQTFPRDALIRLLMRAEAVVGVNYRRRDPDVVMPTAVRIREGKSELITPEGDGIEQIHHMGLGMCLVHSSVLKAIGQPMFKDEVAADGMSVIGEDVFFFHRVRTAGFPVYVDHALSMEVGHVAETELRFPLAGG